jgi:predicted 2-oxoglutarate/Fe(II)-dependent dioxygenase YbiX
MLPLVKKHEVNKGAFVQGAFNEFLHAIKNQKHPEIVEELEAIVHNLTEFATSLQTPMRTIASQVNTLTNNIKNKINMKKQQYPVVFNNTLSNDLDPKIFETYHYLDWDKDFQQLFTYVGATSCSVSNITTIYNEFIGKYQLGIRPNLTPLRNFEILVLDHIADYNKIRFDLRRNKVLCDTLEEYVINTLRNNEYSGGFRKFFQDQSVLEEHFNTFFKVRKDNKNTVFLFNPRDVSGIKTLLQTIYSKEFKNEHRYLTLLMNYDKSLISPESASLLNRFIRIHSINVLTLGLGLSIIKQAVQKDTLIFDHQLINKEVQDKHPDITSKDISHVLYYLKRTNQPIPSVGVGIASIRKTKNTVTDTIIADQKYNIRNQTQLLEEFTDIACSEELQDYYSSKYDDDPEQWYVCKNILADLKYNPDMSIEDNLYQVILKIEHPNNPTIQLFYKLFKEQTDQAIIANEASDNKVNLNQQRNDVWFNTYKLLLGNVLRLNIQNN